jgi:sulfate adenylyltransferase subunit 1
VTQIVYSIDVNTGEQQKAKNLNKNEIAVCTISLADKIVLDEFAQHKTLGELILIDRVTNMTSACGVVTGIEEESGELSLHRINRETRAALKGQTAVTVEFPLNADGVTLEVVQEVEKRLSAEGRHTYLYQPKAGEPIADILKHLHHAGIVVLLAKTDDVDTTEAAAQFKSYNYFKKWLNKTGTGVDDIVAYIKQVSAFTGDVSRHGDYI